MLNVQSLLHFHFYFLVLVTAFYWIQTLGLFSDLSLLNRGLTTLSGVFQTLNLMGRWLTNGTFPLSNLYESLLFLSWALTAFIILVNFNFPWLTYRVDHFFQTSIIQKINANKLPFMLNKTPMQLPKNNWIVAANQEQNQYPALYHDLLGSILLPMVLLVNMFIFFLPDSFKLSYNLVPALQSNWLQMHVVVMISAYALLLLGCLFSMAYLVLSVFFIKTGDLVRDSDYQEDFDYDCDCDSGDRCDNDHHGWNTVDDHGVYEEDEPFPYCGPLPECDCLPPDFDFSDCSNGDDSLDYDAAYADSVGYGAVYGDLLDCGIVYDEDTYFEMTEGVIYRMRAFQDGRFDKVFGKYTKEALEANETLFLRGVFNEAFEKVAKRMSLIVAAKRMDQVSGSAAYDVGALIEAIMEEKTKKERVDKLAAEMVTKVFAEMVVSSSGLFRAKIEKLIFVKDFKTMAEKMSLIIAAKVRLVKTDSGSEILDRHPEAKASLAVQKMVNELYATHCLSFAEASYQDFDEVLDEGKAMAKRMTERINTLLTFSSLRCDGSGYGILNGGCYDDFNELDDRYHCDCDANGNDNPTDNGDSRHPLSHCLSTLPDQETKPHARLEQHMSKSTKGKGLQKIKQLTYEQKKQIQRQKQLKKLAEMWDNYSYRSIGLGFPLLTMGLLSGAVWANQTWGSYWSWDPKETWALITWFIFAIYLHTRLSKGWSGRKSAWLALFGFITLWVCYLGVNLMAKGLHSYGFLR